MLIKNFIPLIVTNSRIEKTNFICIPDILFFISICGHIPLLENFIIHSPISILQDYTIKRSKQK